MFSVGEASQTSNSTIEGVRFVLLLGRFTSLPRDKKDRTDSFLLQSTSLKIQRELGYIEEREARASVKGSTRLTPQD